MSDDKYKKVLAAGANVAKEAIIAESPIGETPVHYIKDGGSKTKRVTAGNLKRSIQVFTFKNTNAVFAGPIVSKKSKVQKVIEKISKRRRAFYWKFVYYGSYGKAPNPFIDRAAAKSKSGVISTLKSETKRYLPKALQNIFD